ncbi:prepilin-type N-terminal cleavage/methylation domain-containing protein [Desulfomicrobium macestii]|uniref:Prepilin-type N-terminal cleavage/methylation domain-containing protein n=1 Tax=Desulfomicrobium macestii TaxID=90731 RepID=A0ABR9H1M5_9BACT|nr:prepilin-type N-terminal cleavage/methylation domain-containing protein [Desulfomicrobium macestii]MBE1424596.1 prepilin-type N-terminal cleavage/methylation domain-containing protein [Desulfomicrobium macestii]
MSKKINQSGMTLVELLVAMVMMGIVITGVYNLFRVHNLMAAKQEETTLMQQELLSAMVQMAEDLRMCGYKATSGPANGFDENETNATSVRCTRDPAPDGSTQIGYILMPNNTIDWLNASSEWVTAAENIADLNFVYRNSNGTILDPINTTNVEDIRFIDITIVAAASVERSGMNIPNRFMNTRVYCRNMGL